MNLFDPNNIADIARQISGNLINSPAVQNPAQLGSAPADQAASGSGLPQYSWGFDPSTQSWGYFVNNNGALGSKIGVNTGDKRLSYRAHPNDSASIAQEALNHLMDTQTTANAPATAAAAPTAAPTTTPVAGSGIGSAAIQHGGNSSRSANGTSDGSDGSSGMGGIAAGLGNLGQALAGTNIGRIASFLSDTIAANNNAGYSNEGNHNGVDAGSPNAGTVGDPNGPTTASAVGAGIAANPMTTDPAQAAANAAAAASDNQSAAESSRLASQNAAASTGEGPSANSGSTGAGDAGNGNTGGENHGNEGTHGAMGGGGGEGGGDKVGGWRHNGMMHAPAQHYATGGLGAAAGLPPRFMRGPGDGQSDSIPVKMDDGADGRLADNEFVVPADAVSALGSGSSEAGARALYDFVDRVRQTAHGHTKQANPVNPSKVLPA